MLKSLHHFKFLRNKIVATHFSSVNESQDLTPLPSHSRVVIGGSGILSNLIAYHLAECGWNDVVVIDRGRIGEETSSWRGPGLVSHLTSTTGHELIRYTASLFENIQNSGHDLGWKRCGSISVARTNDRFIFLKKLKAACHVNKINADIVDCNQMKAMHPLLCTDGLVGGVWIPEDGVASSNLVCTVFARLAQNAGVKYVENCLINSVKISNNQVCGVETERGFISCDIFVNSLGMWSRDMGLKSKPKIRIPVHSAEQFFIITDQMPDFPPNMPSLHDSDGGIYVREWQGGFLSGGFHPFAANSCANNESINIGPLMADLKKRLPCFQRATINQIVSGFGNFTADGKWIFGPAPGIDDYYVAVGMNGNSVQAAGGIAKAVTQLITSGSTEFDILPFDIKRFIDTHNNSKYLRERAKEIVGRYFAVDYPLQNEFKTARKLRCSPLYTEQASAGAVFGERMGFERALYFDTNQDVSNPELPPGTFMAPQWVDFVREEYFYCREGVAVIDMSSYAKFEVKSAGSEALDYLQFLCCNDIDIPVGSIVQTGMQNERGGYENDCIILRTAENRFFTISPTAQETRILDWMHHHIPPDSSLAISDVTSMFTVLNIIGPKSEQLMIELTGFNMNIPPFKFQHVDVGYASEVMVMRYTSTGEPGYTLYIPSEYALHIHEQLMRVGNDYGIKNAGYYTLRFLRIEKFIPFWAEELDSNTTPFEVGRDNIIKFDKCYFIGKEALWNQHKDGVKRRLALFMLENHSRDTDIWPWGKEPIYRNGVHVGMTTSAGYGFSLGRMVCLGFVRNIDSKTGEAKKITNEYLNDKEAIYEIDIAGKLFKARLSLQPPSIPIVKMGGKQTKYVPKLRSHEL